MPVWQCGPYRLDLTSPKIMAIINVTTDSFSGDGLALRRDMIRAKAEKAIADGAHILDVGGESTRPGAPSIPLQEELDRVVPVVEDLASFGVPVSVDTLKPEVMRAVIQAGAVIINDIHGLEAPDAMEAVSESTVGVCLMHMQGEPRTMQQAPVYGNVVEEVGRYLQTQAAELESRGVAKSRITLDPGFGFGKTLEHNLTLFRNLETLKALGYPLLIGVSRKTMLGLITGRPVEQRTTASVVAALMSIERGASVVRVHDVAETRDALWVWQAIRNAQ